MNLEEMERRWYELLHQSERTDAELQEWSHLSDVFYGEEQRQEQEETAYNLTQLKW